MKLVIIFLVSLALSSCERLTDRERITLELARQHERWEAEYGRESRYDLPLVVKVNRRLIEESK